MASKIPQALLDWLSGCPYIDSLSEDGVAVHIEQLGSEPIQFSLHATPTEAVVKRYFSGELRAKNYVLASRMEYTMDDVQRAEQSAFWDDFAAWCEVMTESKRLPDLGEGRDARSLLCTTNGYIQSMDTVTCQFQIQLQLVYYQDKLARRKEVLGE